MGDRQVRLDLQRFAVGGHSPFGVVELGVNCAEVEMDFSDVGIERDHLAEAGGRVAQFALCLLAHAQQVQCRQRFGIRRGQSLSADFRQRHLPGLKQLVDGLQFRRLRLFRLDFHRQSIPVCWYRLLSGE